MVDKEKKQATKSTDSEHQKSDNFRFYWRLVGMMEYKWLLLPMMLLGYCMVAGGNVGFADWLRTVTGTLNSEDRGNALDIALLLVAYLCIRGLGTLMGAFANQHLGTRLGHHLRELVFQRMLHSPMQYFYSTKQGDHITRITYIVNNASEGITRIGMIGIRDGLQIVGLLSYLMYLNWNMTVLLILVFPPLILIFAGATQRVRTLVKSAQSGMGQISQAVSEAVDGMAVVKVYQAEEREANLFARKSHQVMDLLIRMALVQAFLIPLAQVLVGLAVAGITYLALSEQLGYMSGESFVAYFVALGMMFAPLRQMTRIHVQFEMCVVAAQSLFEFLDSGTESDEGIELPERIASDIVARDLNFTYPSGVRALTDVNFVLKPGTVTALVGHSGSGKTTITSLLCGFYRDWQGRLEVGGQDLREVTIASQRRQVSIVSQEVVLFSGTIADNIAYGRPDATREELEQAATRAAATGFIEQLQQGFDTFVGPGGAQLSGGQKQRLSIARAFLSDSPLVILDEATASLDNLSERRVQKVLRRLARGRIVLVVSHRLQFVRDADTILVMSGGEIVERGSHDELLVQDGYYAALYESKPEIPAAMKDANTPTISDAPAFGLPTQLPHRHRPSLFNMAAFWYQRSRWLWLVAPLSLFFFLLWSMRSLLYTLRLLRPVRLPVPVVVVGNVTVGGTGKTPLVIWLGQSLQRRGLRVGIVSRGYGGRSPWYPLTVKEETHVQHAGEEAWLLHRKVDCPVVVGPDRLAAGAQLLREHDCDLILSDDGLQHTRMGRDAEIITLDGRRRFGNGIMLPAGPLREPSSPRLRKALCAVIKDKDWPELACDGYRMALHPTRLIHLGSEQAIACDQWPWQKRVHACAAIGNPNSFFDLLRTLGFEVIEHAFPDHHKFVVKELLFPDGLAVVMTEKDAPKCRDMQISNIWYLEVEAEVMGGESLVDRLLTEIGLQLSLPSAPSATEIGSSDEATANNEQRSQVSPV